MTSEKLQDALNELDESLINDVAAFREHPRKRTYRSLYPVAIAACLCLTAIALLVVQMERLRQPLDTGTSTSHVTDATMTTTTTIATAVTEIQSEGAVTEPYLDGSAGSVTTGSTAAVASVIPGNANTTRTKKTTYTAQLAERPTVIVRITQWQENGFVGVVTEWVDTTIFEIGETVTVRFLDEIGFEVTNDQLVSYYNREPTENDLPIDSVVSVRFASASDISKPDDDMTVLYAEGIGMVIP